jgi:hypothetical protein
MPVLPPCDVGALVVVSLSVARMRLETGQSADCDEAPDKVHSGATSGPVSKLTTAVLLLAAA